MKEKYDIEPHLFVKQSPVAGNGLFTSRSFKKGDAVFVMKGPTINFHPKNKEESLTLPNIVGLDKDLYIDPIYPYVCINHRCDPNLAVGNDGVTYIALRDISAGEELTFDYSISEHTDWEMDCNCGSINCRKVIRSIEKLPSGFFAKYFPLIPPYFEKVYIKKYIEDHE